MEKRTDRMRSVPPIGGSTDARGSFLIAKPTPCWWGSSGSAFPEEGVVFLPQRSAKGESNFFESCDADIEFQELPINDGSFSGICDLLWVFRETSTH